MEKAKFPACVCWKLETLEIVVGEDDIVTNLPETTRRAIDDLWTDAMAQGRVKYENGVLLATNSKRHGSHVSIDCARGRYRHLLAATELSMPWSGLAVTGLVTTARAPGGLILCGKRADNLATSPGAYELAPSGTLELDDLSPSGNVDVQRRFLSELQEETGLAATAIRQTKPIGVISCVGTQDVVVGAEIDMGSLEMELPATAEYSDLRFLSLEQIRGLMKERPVVPTMPLILDQLAPDWLNSSNVVRPQ